MSSSFAFECSLTFSLLILCVINSSLACLQQQCVFLITLAHSLTIDCTEWLFARFCVWINKNRSSRGTKFCFGQMDIRFRSERSFIICGHTLSQHWRKRGRKEQKERIDSCVSIAMSSEKERSYSRKKGENEKELILGFSLFSFCKSSLIFIFSLSCPSFLSLNPLRMFFRSVKFCPNSNCPGNVQLEKMQFCRRGKERLMEKCELERNESVCFSF